MNSAQQFSCCYVQTDTKTDWLTYRHGDAIRVIFRTFDCETSKHWKNTCPVNKTEVIFLNNRLYSTKNEIV